MFINIWVLYGIFIFVGICLTLVGQGLHKNMRMRRTLPMVLVLVLSPIFTAMFGVGTLMKISSPVKDMFIFWGGSLLFLFICLTIVILDYLKHSIEIK